jgi:hypothetical protein
MSMTAAMEIDKHIEPKWVAAGTVLFGVNASGRVVRQFDRFVFRESHAKGSRHGRRKGF